MTGDPGEDSGEESGEEDDEEKDQGEGDEEEDEEMALGEDMVQSPRIFYSYIPLIQATD